MPEERHAAEEHALLAQVSEPLSGLPPEPAALSAEPDFPIVLRGYDRIAVDAYVKHTNELLTELRSTHSPDAAVRRALERVGEQIAGILQRAHDTAAEITAGSRREAEDRLIEARREAEEIVVAARARLEEIDAETDRVWAERERIVEEVRGLAHELLGLSESAASPAELEIEAGPAPIPAADPDRTAPMPPVFDLEHTEETEETGDPEPLEHHKDTADDPDATTILRRPDDPPA
jgi:cell division septum initiation protein DivIVA